MENPEESSVQRLRGFIFPIADETMFTRETWCELIRNRPEFYQPPPRQVPNPFKPGERIPAPVHPDFAWVIVNRQKVGTASWSMSEEPLVVVDVDPLAASLVREWAEAMHGAFREEDWGE